jgi:polyhydroxyalkanoate synthesis regulator phasin
VDFVDFPGFLTLSRARHNEQVYDDDMVTDTRTEPMEATDRSSAASVLGVLRAVHDTLGSVVQGVDAGEISGTEAAAVVGECAAIERLAQAGKLVAAGRVAACDTWRTGGHRSAADWLASVTKCSRAEARALIETADRLAGQPQVDEAVRRGDLNSDQATAVSDAVAADPSAESTLIEEAEQGSLASLRDQCAKRKAAAQGDDTARAERLWKQRQARTRIGPDGAWELDTRNTPDAGTIIEAALATFGELAFQASKAAGRRDSHAACTADALEMMAAAALGLTPTCVLRRRGDATSPPTEAAHAEPASTPTGMDETPPRPDGSRRADRPDPTTGATRPVPAESSPAPLQPDLFEAASGRTVSDAPQPSPRPAHPADVDESPPAPHERSAQSFGPGYRVGRPPDTVIPWDPVPTGGVRLPGGNRVKIIVRIDHAALVRGCTRAGETCDIVGLGPLPVASVVRLMATGDPFLTAVVTRGHDVASVVHLGRHPTSHQRTALEWRDQACVIAGCTNRFCDADHNEGWTITHDTRTGDLALLCGPHHRKKTLGWRLVGSGTRRRLLPPDGSEGGPG